MPGEVGIIVQARMSSSRFPGKSLQELGRIPLILCVLKRLQLTGLPVVVCTSIEPSDNVLYNLLKSEGYSCFRGSLDNVLERYIQTAEAFGIENIVRVTGDNPLVDIHYLKESLSLFEDYEYADGIYPGGLIKGTGFEFISLSELKGITSDNKQHLEHVTSWLRENMASSGKRIQIKPNNFNAHREGLYLTCDHKKDLELLQIIFENFDFRYDMKIEDIVVLLENNPTLKAINANLH